jgi:two-component system, OmpR family, sensor histidine kinase TctE
VPLVAVYAARLTYSYSFISALGDRIYDQSLYTLGRTVAQQIHYNTANTDPEFTSIAEDAFRSDHYDNIYILVRGAGGKAIIGDVAIPDPPSHADCKISCFYDSVISENPVRVYFLHGSPDPENANYSIKIYTAETLNKRTTLTHDVIENLLFPQLLTIAIITLVIWFGIGKGLAPLNALQAAVARRSHLDLHPVDVTNVPDEVRPLVESINDLMSRLEAVIDAQNRFIADAAHQLRTPLAGLKTQIEYALRETDPDNSRHAVKQAFISADRLVKLVNQLLTLAHNEPAADKSLKMETVDLVQLGTEITMEWVPEALQKHIDLGFESDGHPLQINCDSVRLKELISNLIDNAIRYTQDGGRITLRVMQTDSSTVLAVEDNGPGIALEDRDLVFERFYRVLGSGVAGSGLGLAIVKDIARSHGWTVSIHPGKEGRGTKVCVTFNTEPVETSPA